MKKILMALLVVAGMIAAKQSDAQQVRFFYYPDANVYFNTVSKKYVVMDNGSWVTVAKLPANVKVVRTPRVVVYHTGNNVWVNNASHKTKYKNNKGRKWVKTKPAN